MLVWIPRRYFSKIRSNASCLLSSSTTVLSSHISRGSHLHHSPQNLMGNCNAKGTIVNCSLHRTASMKRGRRDSCGVIRVMTETCRIIEYKGPIRVKDIIGKFPRHAIFRQGDALLPLRTHELLTDDQLYYLFPLVPNSEFSKGQEVADVLPEQKGKYAPGGNSNMPALDHIRSSEVLPSTSNGFWRVKLAINASQLADILSEDVNTEALIDRMRMFASSSPQRKQKDSSITGSYGQC